MQYKDIDYTSETFPKELIVIMYVMHAHWEPTQQELIPVSLAWND